MLCFPRNHGYRFACHFKQLGEATVLKLLQTTLKITFPFSLRIEVHCVLENWKVLGDMQGSSLKADD